MTKSILMIKDIVSKLFFILNKGQRYLSVLLLFLTLVGALLEVVGVSAVLPFIQAMIYPEQLRNNEYINQLILFLDLKSDGQILLLIAIGVILVYLLKKCISDSLFLYSSQVCHLYTERAWRSYYEDLYETGVSFFYKN